MQDKFKKEAIKNMRKTPYAQDRDRDICQRRNGISSRRCSMQAKT